MKVEQAKAMTDDDVRFLVQRVLRRPLQIFGLITIGKTLVVVAAFDRSPLRQVLL